ncbi:nucleotidyltransferase domain-containing protein [Phormidium pseudopriestleyi FRX01]|uniref:Nucleotidyltransferase domain-containing protein n=1 Tax=Phormidium pseudopriestleyi FRX01 TaxID=1759528 RepID=A0ABS3FM64_9CYAN|nr:nucleotidyltransferase domain-containing protein [Phormidium pseudopriestleyi]MBO0348196.1 nucleotidyltransferase domain-containing protein [Phormidium pseudopriestleyi FRX01]
MSFNTSYLDKALKEKRFRLEQERQILLRKTIQWLDEFGSKYGIKKAYIFGSVTQPYKFHSQSDIDIAVEEINSEDFFSVIGFISEALARDVDVIQMNQCHFAHRIREKGIVWIAKL